MPWSHCGSGGGGGGGSDAESLAAATGCRFNENSFFSYTRVSLYFRQFQLELAGLIWRSEVADVTGAAVCL